METIYIFFVIGFVVLIMGAKWLVEGAVSLGIRANLSPLVIGLTVVAFGTSLPELVINVFASLKGSSDLAIGNVLGSNIMNIFFILGVTAIIFPINVERISVRRDLPIGIFATIFLFITANGYFLGFENVISRIDGIVLLIMFGLYLFMTLRSKNPIDPDMKIDTKIPESWLKTTVLLIAGLTGLYFGGEWVSEGALAVAKAMGLSESAVGLTIVAAATSLPELATSIVAALKKNVGIVMGNILGSNIMNILIVLGTSAIINPLDFNTKLNTEIGMLLLANLGLFSLIHIGKGLHLSRREGVILTTVYIVFVWFSVVYN
ncbi:MAG: sodium:proton exchanger [Bacteroidetes bacterium HGW-Bacteroidetes-1]|nr:MAG: sodium:proton exchanger [Bacteroidetes bacterium HGW-Bacteroidetes-1]